MGTDHVGVKKILIQITKKMRQLIQDLKMKINDILMMLIIGSIGIIIRAFHGKETWQRRLIYFVVSFLFLASYILIAHYYWEVSDIVKMSFASLIGMFSKSFFWYLFSNDEKFFGKVIKKKTGIDIEE